MRWFVGGLLVAHGVVQLLYLAPVPENDATWPFLIEESWLVPPAARRGVGIAFVMAIVAVCVLAALSIWGVPGLREAGTGLLVGGSVLSLALFAAYWHPWLAIGTLIATALLLLAAVGPDWWTNLID